MPDKSVIVELVVRYIIEIMVVKPIVLLSLTAVHNNEHQHSIRPDIVLLSTQHGCVHVCVCVCVCVRARTRVGVCVFVHACARVCVCTSLW
jgi:hypothetical protein